MKSTAQSLALLPTQTLQKKRRFNEFALITVGIGASIALLASFYRLGISGTYPFTTGIVSLIALGAAWPVFQERKRVMGVLEKRSSAK